MPIEGLDRLVRKLRKIDRESFERVTDAVQQSGEAMRTDAVLTSSKPGKGRIYKRGDGPPHQASAPGDPFASDTGRLIGEGGISTQEINGGLGVLVGTNVEYGPHLEFGTSKMAARPWLRPAYNRSKDGAVTAIRTAMNQLFRSVARRGA
jgi:HK97 gp10 family phage protein